MGLSSAREASGNFVVPREDAVGSFHRRGPYDTRKGGYGFKKKDDQLEALRETMRQPIQQVGHQRTGNDAIGKDAFDLPSRVVAVIKVLGLHIDARLSFQQHVDGLLNKAELRTGIPASVRAHLGARGWSPTDDRRFASDQFDAIRPSSRQVACLLASPFEGRCGGD